MLSENKTNFSSLADALVASQFPSSSDGNPYVNLLAGSLRRAGVDSHPHHMYIGGRGRLPVHLDPDWLDRHQGELLEDAAFAAALRGGVSKIRAYLRRYPGGRHAKRAQRLLDSGAAEGD